MPNPYKQELLQRIVDITTGPDPWNNTKSRLRQEVYHMIDSTIRKKFLNVIDALQPPYAYFSDTDRERLIEVYADTNSSIERLFTVRKNFFDKLVEYNFHLASEIQTFSRDLVSTYDDFIRELSDKNKSFYERKNLLSAKTSIFIPEKGWYYIDKNLAYQLTSLSPYSLSEQPTTVVSKERGSHAVAALGDVHFKSNLSGPTIQPAKEDAAATGLNMFVSPPSVVSSSSSTSSVAAAPFIAAPSTLVVIEGIHYHYIPAPSEQPLQNATAYQAWREQLLSGRHSADIFSENPGLAAELQQETNYIKVLVQASYSIPGVNLLDVLMLQHLFAYVSEKCKADPRAMQAFIASMLVKGVSIATPGACVSSSSSTSDEVKTLRSFFDLGQVLLAQTAETMTSSSTASIDTGRIRLGSRYHELFPGMREADFNLAYDKLGQDELIAILGIFKHYPNLATDIEFNEAILFLKLFGDVIPKLFPTSTIDTICKQIPELFNTLDPESASALIGLMFMLASDARFANFIFVPAKDGRLAYIVAVDLDDSTNPPYTLVAKANGEQKISAELKNEFFLFKPWRDLALHNNTIQRILQKSPQQWFTELLLQWSEQNNVYQSMIEQGVLHPCDIIARNLHAPMQLPLQLKPDVFLYMYQLFCQLHSYLRIIASSQNQLKHGDIINYLYPTTSATYDRIEQYWLKLTKKPMDVVAIQQATQSSASFMITPSQCFDASLITKTELPAIMTPCDQDTSDTRSNAWRDFLQTYPCIRDFNDYATIREEIERLKALPTSPFQPLNKVAQAFIHRVKINYFCLSIENLQLLNALVATFPDVVLPYMHEEQRKLISETAYRDTTLGPLLLAMPREVRVIADKTGDSSASNGLPRRKRSDSFFDRIRLPLPWLSSSLSPETTADKVSNDGMPGQEIVASPNDTKVGVPRTQRMQASSVLGIPSKADSPAPVVSSMPSVTRQPWQLYSELSKPAEPLSSPTPRRFNSTPSAGQYE